MTNTDCPRFPERAENAAPGRMPPFDPAEYRADLADMKLSDAQEIELLQILWSIMGSFARMGFEADVCGLIFGEFNHAAECESADGMLDHSTHKETPSEDEGSGGDT